MMRAIEEIYRPENFVGICRAPADLMMAITGDAKLWDIPEREINILASQSATAARYFMRTDPKWVALLMFSLSLGTTYGSRAVIQFKKSREDKEDNE